MLPISEAPITFQWCAEITLGYDYQTPSPWVNPIEIDYITFQQKIFQRAYREKSLN